MSKEKILKAELDKITDKVFSYGKPEKKENNHKHKSKEATTQQANHAVASSRT